jgi:hypothetical protein
MKIVFEVKSNDEGGPVPQFLKLSSVFIDDSGSCSVMEADADIEVSLVKGITCIPCSIFSIDY